jgi:hypothetical protein
MVSLPFFIGCLNQTIILQTYWNPYLSRYSHPPSGFSGGFSAALYFLSRKLGQKVAKKANLFFGGGNKR